MKDVAIAGIASAVAAAFALPLAAAVVSGVSLAMQPSWAVRCAQKRWPNVLFFQPTREPVVALTIDDGPHEDITPEILEILKVNNCKATWFIIGSNMDICPELVEQIHGEGHEVGNHTMHDVASWRLPLEEFERQLLCVDRRLTNLYFEDGHCQKIKWFRPGHGFFTKKMLHVAERHGYRTALGSLFPLDTLFTNQGENIAKYLLWRVQSGDIIILHDREPQKSQTAKVLRTLLPELRERGFSVVTLSELLKLRRA